MEAPPVVQELVERFLTNQQHFMSPAYGEAATRIEFVNPLFQSLGWDMSNAAGYADAYKDVVVEYNLKVGSSHTSPDYSFRVGGERKFFVEAKKPAIDITKDPAPAYQIRRYAWTAKLPISVLVNFRHLAIYDGTAQPSQANPSVARTLLVPAESLVSRWDEVVSLLGKDSVYRGSLDRYASAASRRKGVSEVDDAFLDQMERWRHSLATNFASRNPSLSVVELNEAVQRTIDRIIFLRIAEARGIEPYGTLQQAAAKPGIYARLLDIFRAADTRYNSGLFQLKKTKDSHGGVDTLTPSLTVDDVVCKVIIQSLYYPTSPYEFSVMPADILGQVYEQFLGKVITLDTTHKARVEDKPEIKKSGGVYYTPSNIVAHIVERTLGGALKGKTPRQARNLRVVDPACGSGSFLLGAYDYLLKWFAEQYEATGGDTARKYLYRTPAGDSRLTLAERKKILTGCIYGVDIDRQAVEVTKLSLLLKVLEGESDETINSQLAFFHMSRVLPDLDRNILSGNSLVGSDALDLLAVDPLEEEALNAFDWALAFPDIMAAGGFDCMIGNPPYDVLEKDRGASTWPHGLLREYLAERVDQYGPALGGKLNLYRLFIVRSLALTRPGGHFGMIVPLSIAGDISTARTRRHLLQSLADTQIDCFPQKDNPHRRVFKRAKLSTGVVTGQRATGKVKLNRPIRVHVFPGNSLSDPPLRNKVTLQECELVDPVVAPIPLTDQTQWRLCVRVHSLSGVTRLGASNDFTITRGEINQTIYRRYIVSSPGDPLLKGVEVAPYGLRSALSQGQREWLDASAFHRDFPARSAPPSRRVATQRITGVDERRRVVAALIESPMYFADSTNSITGLEEVESPTLGAMVALLNSDLMQWRFRLTSTNNNVGTNELEALPMRLEEGQALKQLQAMTERLARLWRERVMARSAASAQALEQRMRAAEHRVNDLVYQLYEISAAERLIIEASLTKRPLLAATA